MPKPAHFLHANHPERKSQGLVYSDDALVNGPATHVLIVELRLQLKRITLAARFHAPPTYRLWMWFPAG